MKKKLFGTAFGLLCGALLALVATGSFTHHQQPASGPTAAGPSSSDPKPEVKDWSGIEFGKPCPGSTRPDVPRLESLGRIWLPKNRPADAAWQCAPDAQFFMYDGIQVLFESGYANYSDDFEAQYAKEHHNGYTIDVNGRLAAVSESTELGIKHEVDLIAGDISVMLLADRTVPIQNLIDLLRSMPIPSGVPHPGPDVRNWTASP